MFNDDDFSGVIRYAVAFFLLAYNDALTSSGMQCYKLLAESEHTHTVTCQPAQQDKKYKQQQTSSECPYVLVVAYCVTPLRGTILHEASGRGRLGCSAKQASAGLKRRAQRSNTYGPSRGGIRSLLPGYFDTRMFKCSTLKRAGVA